MKNTKLCSYVLTIVVSSLLSSSSSSAVGEDSPEDRCADKEWTPGAIDESLNGLDQEDPVLIEAVKRLLIRPDKTKPYNILGQEPIPMGGEWKQVPELVKLFGRSRNGFFIEAGAHDGVDISNTLYLERQLGWTGILVEPNPDTFATLLTVNRKSFAFGHCLSTTTTAQTVDFDAAGVYGGILHNNIQRQVLELPGVGFANENAIYRRTIKAQCFPIYSLIQAVGNPTIDLLSLDVEGAEYGILKSIPWDKVNIRVLLIEVNHIGEIFEETREEFDKLLDEAGYEFYMNISIDNIYVRKDFEWPKNLKRTKN